MNTQFTKLVTRLQDASESINRAAATLAGTIACLPGLMSDEVVLLPPEQRIKDERDEEVTAITQNYVEELSALYPGYTFEIKATRFAE